MRVFLDANGLFTAAHNSEGRSAALFTLAPHVECTLHASTHAVTEARRNLEIKGPEKLRLFERLVSTLSIEPEASAKALAWAAEQGLPPKDAPILAAAARARADLLVTGDRAHFGPLYGRRLRGVEIVTPAQALGRLLA